MTTTKALALTILTLSLAGPALATSDRGFSLQVLLEGAARPEYRARDSVYVEAIRGREYTLRITNPLPVRVAVALAVDGLNTIDARHSDARTAAKWVLDPYETIEIAGWQTSGSEARRFFFTGERSSYGAWLGLTDNLGVIEAVFYQERAAPIVVQPAVAPPAPPARQEKTGSQPGSRAPVPQSSARDGLAGGVQDGVVGVEMEATKLSDEYAATGIGQLTRHQVEWVRLELEGKPAATVRIRYEFREQLARLGVLPRGPRPLDRREGARGFSERYCPNPSDPR